MADALARAPGRVVAMLAVTRAPWWVIGSAAVVLHGARGVAVRDVNVLLDPADVPWVAAATGASFAAGVADGRFRSQRIAGGALPVELFAGPAVRDGEGWTPVRLHSREVVAAGGAVLHVPAARELAALLRRFGRPKDHGRAALLDARE